MSFFRPVNNDSPKTNAEVMVDIETMGVAPGCPVITIGAVIFNPMESETYHAMIKRAFLVKVDVEDAVDQSNGVEGSTLKWWLAQEDGAIKALLAPDAVPLKMALTDFYDYCKSRGLGYTKKFFEDHHHWPTACKIWAKSPDFDCKILEAACKSVKVNFPFRFYEYRCVRTIQDLAWPDGDRPRFGAGEGVLHDARHDAVIQALMVQSAYRTLGITAEKAEFLE